jgi:peptidyl-prolyl cis-trans isomerase SDCCAG10
MPEAPRKVPLKPQDPSTSKTTSTFKKDTNKDTNGKIHEIRAQHAREQASGRCVPAVCSFYFSLTYLCSTARQGEIAKMEAEIRDLTRRRKDAPDSDEEDGHPGKKAKPGPSLLEQELARYGKGRDAHVKGKKKKDESDILAALDRFRGKLKVHAQSPGAENATPKGDGALPVPDGDEEDVPDVDADDEWMGHQLYFPKDDGAESFRAAHEYEVIDPRARGQAAKEEEMQRKRAKRRNRAFERHSGEGGSRSHD